MNKRESRSNGRRKPLFVFVAIGLVLGGLVAVGANHWRARAAANLFVAVGGSDASNTCTSPGNPCRTIQHAVDQSAAGDVINVGPGTYVENVNVTQSVTIDGSLGPTVDGNNMDSVFKVPGGVTATLSGLTITHGTANNGLPFGGGVQSQGTLTVDRCTVTHNAPTAGNGVFGGGLANVNGTMTVTNSTISNNSAPLGGGGGLYTAAVGPLTVINCTITGNTTDNSGGGIDAGEAANTTVINTTISGNTAGFGGGISNGAVSTMTVINSTISGNSAASGGGGIDNFLGTVTVTNCTIGGNSATTGGGIDNEGHLNIFAETLNITNTIIAGSLQGGDVVNGQNSTIAVNDHNLIQDGSASPFLSGDPKLGPLQNNGGPTFTQALLAGSPAIDAGDDSVLSGPLNLTTDQRGTGFLRNVGAHVDIGAYESGNPAAPTVNCPGDTPTVTDPGKSTATVSFSATAVDSTGNPLTPVFTIGTTVITSPHLFPIGMTAVTVSATDSGGRTFNCSFTVDVTCSAPIIMCPANITVFTDPGKTTASVSFAATANDPCGGPVTPTYQIGSRTISSPFVFPVGTTTVTASATGSGGQSSCSFTVTVTLLNECIQDDHSGDTFRFNSTTGQYVYTRCKDKFTMSGTGVVSNSSGLATLTDSKSDRRVSAGANPGTRTGRANITLILAPGVYQTITVNETNPFATCACP